MTDLDRWPTGTFNEDAKRCLGREQGVWQRRFWEHQIRDEGDLTRHVEYVHYNPVKHGLVSAPREWPHSSFHRCVRAGVYAEEWGAGGEMLFERGVGSE